MVSARFAEAWPFTSANEATALSSGSGCHCLGVASGWPWPDAPAPHEGLKQGKDPLIQPRLPHAHKLSVLQASASGLCCEARWAISHGLREVLLSAIVPRGTHKSLCIPGGSGWTQRELIPLLQGSYRPVDLGRSAGARFTVILLDGYSKPLVVIAAFTRSLLSLTAVSASPTISVLG